MGYRVGVVTGTSAHEVEKVLPPEIRDLLDVLVTGESVRHGKPYPEPYMKGILGLGIQPARCLVVENAPFGLRSALAAGALVAAIKNTLPENMLGDAHFILDSVKDVPRLLSEQFTRPA